MDYLTKQAPEILALIFDEVRLLNGRQQMVGAVCKALLPFTRQNLFHDVVLGSYDQVDKFIQSVDGLEGSNPNAEYLGSLIKSLSVKISPQDIEEKKLPRQVGLFRNLNNVRKVTIERSVHLSRAILSSTVAGIYLPKLESLVLLSFRHLRPHPLDPSCWANLSSYKLLHELEVKLTSADPNYEEDEENLPSRYSTEAFTLPQITSLKIGGQLEDSSQDLKHFLSLFDGLIALILEDEWRIEALQATFGPSTATLQHLSLSNTSRFDSGLYHLLSERIEQTSNLVSVRFGGFYTYSVSTIEVLSRLAKLETVVLDDHEWLPPVEKLELLIDPMTRHAPMRSLIINSVDGRQGRDFSSLDRVPDVADLGWELPRWPLHFKFDNAQDLIATASKFEFDLRGSLLQAMEVQLEYKRQVEIVERRSREREQTPRSL